MSKRIVVPAQAPSHLLETLAHRLRQGPRTVYYAALRMDQLNDTLPEEVDPKVITHNRRFVPSHAKNIADYLNETDAWVFGPVTLSVDPGYVTFEVLSGQASDAEPALGTLTLSEGARSTLRIIDGQHRRRAIRDYLQANEADVDPDRRKHFQMSQMPVALYVESDLSAIRQMFADMAQQRRMDPITTARFNMRDPFNRAADLVLQGSEWIEPFVEMNSSTVPPTNQKLLSFSQLAQNLKTLEYGYGGRASRSRVHDAAQDVQRIAEDGLRWFDEVLPTARSEYRALMQPDIDPGYLPQERPKTVAYNPTMIRILSGCDYLWRETRQTASAEQLTEILSRLDLRTPLESGPLVDCGVVEPNGTTLIPRVQIVKPAISQIVADARIERGA